MSEVLAILRREKNEGVLPLPTELNRSIMIYTGTAFHTAVPPTPLTTWRRHTTLCDCTRSKRHALATWSACGKGSHTPQDVMKSPTPPRLS